MSKEKNADSDWEGTPLGEAAKRLSETPTEENKEDTDGPIIFEGLHRPEDNDDHPNYPAPGIWR